jgi:hypothetical protein
VIMGNRRAPKLLGPCMSPLVAADGGVSKPSRPPTAYEQRVYEVGGDHTAASCVVPLLCKSLSRQQLSLGHAGLFKQQLTRMIPGCVQQMCKAIPKGKVSTYGQMAKALSSSARAVGQVGCL